MPSILTKDIARSWAHTLTTRREEVKFAVYLFETAEGLLRLVGADEPNKRILLTMGMCILQDYDEVLAMWSLGFGDGATKLVRPLYEKVLTFSYLAAHPNEITDFTDYNSVQWNKILTEGAVASEEGENWISAEERERITSEYARVRDRYRMTDCKKCKTEKTMPSWTKKGTPELAAATHPVMRGMYFNGFLAPTLTIHPTFVTMATQCQVTDGKLEFNREVLEEDNDAAFGVAISMIFVTISTMNDFFSLGRAELVKDVAAQFASFIKSFLKLGELPGAPGRAPRSSMTGPAMRSRWMK